MRSTISLAGSFGRMSLRSPVADRNDADALAAEMAEHAAMLRPDVKKAVQHVSLSAAPGEHLTDEQWQRVAEAYRQKMGFKDNQYVLVRHADTGHDHVHLVMNRVSMTGALVSTRFDYRRQELALDQIEHEQGLMRTHEQLSQQMREHPEQAIDALLRNRTSFTERDLRWHLGRALRDDAEIERAVTRVLKDADAPEGAGLPVVPLAPRRSASVKASARASRPVLASALRAALTAALRRGFPNSGNPAPGQ